MEKYCPDCEQTLSQAEFYKNKSRADGLQNVCKVCSKVRSVDYQKRNPDVKKKNDKLYTERHVEELKEKRAAYWQRTLPARRKTRQEWYKENREANLTYQARWREENAESKRKKDRQYQKDNPNVYHASRQRRRARKRNANGVASVEQIHARIDYYGGCCWICGETYDVMDHVIPLALGGTGWPANLRPCCNKHNLAKGAKHPSLFSPVEVEICPLP